MVHLRQRGIVIQPSPVQLSFLLQGAQPWKMKNQTITSKIALKRFQLRRSITCYTVFREFYSAKSIKTKLTMTKLSWQCSTNTSSNTFFEYTRWTMPNGQKSAKIRGFEFFFGKKPNVVEWKVESVWPGTKSETKWNRYRENVAQM